MAIMIGTEVERIAETLGDLGGEQALLLALMRRLAGVIDDVETAPYVVASASRELRAALLDLTGAPGPRQGIDDSDLAAIVGSWHARSR
jgi:hypothetical protein